MKMTKTAPPFKRRSKSYAYKMGADYARNGANTINCNLSIFSSKENTAEWEREELQTRTKAIIELARNEYEGDDGDVQVDSNARVSEGDDNGCYVSAWVWVSFAGTEFDKEKEL